MKQRQVTPKEIHTRVYSERDIRCLDWNNQSFMMSTPKRHMMPPTYAWLESHIYPSHLLCNVWYPRRTIQWLISIHASISLCRRSHTLDTNHQSRSLATCNRYSALPTSSHSEVDGVGFIVSWWLCVYYIYRYIDVQSYLLADSPSRYVAWFNIYPHWSTFIRMLVDYVSPFTIFGSIWFVKSKCTVLYTICYRLIGHINLCSFILLDDIPMFDSIRKTGSNSTRA